MSSQYVDQRDQGYWVAGTRVSLDSIVYAFLDGRTAESIAQSFPVLTLEQVYGAIAFYLANRSKIDSYLAQVRVDFEALRQAARNADPMFYQKLADARRQRQALHHEGTISGGCRFKPDYSAGYGAP
ncbi:MAG TPA: DUF433 domain-containing protein [Candidatus Binatia bacterium]|jgi:uncharacterized protein (DUF433 family)